MRYDVRSPFKGTTVYGGGEGIVYDKGHTVAVSHFGKAFDVEYVTSGIGYGFTEETFGVGAESLFDFFIIFFMVTPKRLYVPP